MSRALPQAFRIRYAVRQDDENFEDLALIYQQAKLT